MATHLVDGRKIAADIYAEVGNLIAQINIREHVPKLAFVMAGHDHSTHSYILSIQRVCQRVGVETQLVELEDGTEPRELYSTLKTLSWDENVHGIILQRPLPARYDGLEAARHITLMKDVDCAHPENLGLLFLGDPRFLPCTAAAVIEVLSREGIEPTGRHVVIIGRSAVVGRPLAHFLARHGVMGDATITLCHSYTKNLAEHTRRADILIAAAGVAGLVRGDMIQPGSVVVDVGTNSVTDPSVKRGFRIVGDVVREEVVGRASVLTPVPGGIGPVTVAMLLKNTVTAAYTAVMSSTPGL